LIRSRGLFVIAVALSAAFLAVAAQLDAFSLPLAGLILAYTLTPVALAYVAQRTPPPVWLDFMVMALLWLPLEFAVGHQWIPKRAQNLMHLAAYVVAIALGISIFLFFRKLQGMKIDWPRSWRDLANLLLGFAACAAILIPLGRAIGFLPPFHLPASGSPLRIASQYLIILAATALPEEILFRSLIQNSIMQKFGASTTTLLIAALIFGCAHLDNGPGPLPNWRYMIVAAIAGVAYGKVFEKSSSIFASAGLHALVDLIKHLNF
jgi:CAAX protease family protein